MSFEQEKKFQVKKCFFQVKSGQSKCIDDGNAINGFPDVDEHDADAEGIRNDPVLINLPKRPIWSPRGRSTIPEERYQQVQARVQQRHEASPREGVNRRSERTSKAVLREPAGLGEPNEYDNEYDTTRKYIPIIASNGDETDDVERTSSTSPPTRWTKMAGSSSRGRRRRGSPA